MIKISRQLRKQRTENYFIDALCNIIRNEGMKAATIRNVAEKAGYNSATIYNYFSNFSHLLLRAHIRFETELLDKIKMDNKIKNADKISNVWVNNYIIMAGYYLTNLNVFECVFVSRYDEGIPDELRAIREQHSEFAQYVNQSLERISIEIEASLDYVNQIHEACVALTVGTVLLYVEQRFNQPHEEILKKLERQIASIIKSNLEENGVKI